MYFCYFIIISHWKKVGPFFWTNLSPHQPNIHCAKFGWNWPRGFGEEDFLISSMYFRYFVITSLWKRARPYIWTNLNSLYPRMLCAKFGWNWPSDLEKKIQISKRGSESFTCPIYGNSYILSLSPFSFFKWQLISAYEAKPSRSHVTYMYICYATQLPSK